MSDSYYRATICMSSMSICSFKYKDIFQIYPGLRNTPGIRDQPVIIEFNDAYRLETGGEERKNAFGEGYGHLDLLHEIVALLQIMTSCPCWIQYDESSVRPGLQEKIEGFSDIRTIHKMRFDEARILNRMNSGCGFVEMQKQSVEFLDSYFRMDTASRRRINSSLLLHQKMRQIMLKSCSMGLVGLVSSIENLVQFDGERRGFIVERCRECSSEKYKVTRRFRDFMETYSEKKFVERYKIQTAYHTEPEFEAINAKKLIDSFYRRRSGITHAGDILEMDRTLSGFAMNEVRLFTEVEALTRIAIFSYILGFETESDINVIDNVQRFYEMISDYSWAIPLWDENTRTMVPEAIEKFKSTASQNEKIMLQFFMTVWHGHETEFDISEAAKMLDRQERNVIADWFLNPFWPNSI